MLLFGLSVSATVPAPTTPRDSGWFKLQTISGGSGFTGPLGAPTPQTRNNSTKICLPALVFDAVLLGLELLQTGALLFGLLLLQVAHLHRHLQTKDLTNFQVQLVLVSWQKI